MASAIPFFCLRNPAGSPSTDFDSMKERLKNQARHGPAGLFWRAVSKVSASPEEPIMSRKAQKSLCGKSLCF
jgi:hypothetical protein